MECALHPRHKGRMRAGVPEPRQQAARAEGVDTVSVRSNDRQPHAHTPEHRENDNLLHPPVNCQKSCPASLQSFSTTGRKRKGSEPTTMRWNTWTRTSSLCGAAAWREGGCSRTTASRRCLHRWASMSWGRTLIKCEASSGWDPRWVREWVLWWWRRKMITF